MSFQLREYKKPDFNEQKFKDAPDASIALVTMDGVAPENFHAMSIFSEYFKIGGKWRLAEESRMDCVPVLRNGKIEVVEFRLLKRGDAVICGRTENCEDGIFLHADGFANDDPAKDSFLFRLNRSRETAFSRDYDELYELLRHDRENGKIVWVLGPAFAFDKDARQAFSKIISAGYADAVLAGNALAAHDLEGAYLHTALGQNIYTQKNEPNGHYNHLDTINAVRECGSIESFLKEKQLSDGIIASCIEHHVPFVLAGSIRDDGPLPPVLGNAYEAQDAMRNELRDATTVICMATMLHTIAVGNMTPSYRVQPDGSIREVYFYCVDISEFMLRKLSDRGSLAAKSIVTNVQDFIVNVAKGLGL